MAPELDSERRHEPIGDNNTDTDSILPVLDYECEGSVGSVSSGSATPAMVGMAGNANATAGTGNNNDPLTTPITPENAAEQAKKINALCTAMKKQKEEIHRQNNSSKSRRLLCPSSRSTGRSNNRTSNSAHLHARSTTTSHEKTRL